MPPPRLFAGRTPAPASPSSGEEGSSTGSKSSPVRVPSQPAKRQRFIARVVTQPSQTLVSRTQKQSSFVPVREIAARKGTPQSPEEYPQDSEESSEQSSSSSGAEYRAAVYEEPGDAEEDGEKEMELLKPVFIPRERRMGSEADRDARGTTETKWAAEERAKESKEFRRREAKKLVSAALNEEEQNERLFGVMGDAADLPDDMDRAEDREAEFALWRVRELLRVKRDREEVAEWRRLRNGERRGVGIGLEEVDRGDEGGGTVEGEKVSVEGGRRGYKVGPFFQELGEDGRLREKIYNREYSDRVGEENGRDNEAVSVHMRRKFGSTDR